MEVWRVQRWKMREGARDNPCPHPTQVPQGGTAPLHPPSYPAKPGSPKEAR